MSEWAYRCQRCAGPAEHWFVSRDAVEEMPAGTRVLRVKVGDEWSCAVVDRALAVAVDGMLVRDAVAAREASCTECEPLLKAHAGEGRMSPARPAAPIAGAALSGARTKRQVQAAAVSIQGVQAIVVLVGLDIVQSPGEADMLITDLRPRLGDHEVVLMGQRDDGAPVYYGDKVITALLGDVLIERLPWKAYDIG